jgi:hypothetical protein
MENMKKCGPFYNLTSEDACVYKNIEETDKYYINTTLQVYTNKDIDSSFLRIIKKSINEDISNRKELANEYSYLVSNIIYTVSERYDGETYNGYDISVSDYYVGTSKNIFKNQILPKCLEYMRTRQEGEGGGLGNGMWLYMAVDYVETDYYYIEMDEDGNVVRDSRNETYDEDYEEDPWLTVD